MSEEGDATVRAAAAAGDNKWLVGWKQGSGYDQRVADAADELTGRRPLHLAAEGGHFAVVVFFLKCGVTVDARDHDMCTPLYLAVATNHVRVVNALLMAGADPRVADTKGRSCVDIAGPSPSMRSLLVRSCDDAEVSPTRLRDFLEALSHVEAMEAEQEQERAARVHTAPHAAEPPLVVPPFSEKPTPVAQDSHAAEVPTASDPGSPGRDLNAPAVLQAGNGTATTPRTKVSSAGAARHPAKIAAHMKGASSPNASPLSDEGSHINASPLSDGGSRINASLMAATLEGCPSGCKTVLLPMIRDLQEQTRLLNSQLEAVSHVLKSQARHNTELKEQLNTLSRCVLECMSSGDLKPALPAATDTRNRLPDAQTGTEADEWREVEWPRQTGTVHGTHNAAKPSPTHQAGQPVPGAGTGTRTRGYHDQKLAGTEREELERELSRLRYERVLAPSPLKDDVLAEQQRQQQVAAAGGGSPSYPSPASPPHAAREGPATGAPLPPVSAPLAPPPAAVRRGQSAVDATPDLPDDDGDEDEDQDSPVGGGRYRPSNLPGVWTLERRIAARQAEIESVQGGVEPNVVQAAMEAQRREKERALLNEAIAAAELSSDKELAAHVKRCQSRERRHEEMKSYRAEQISKLSDLKAVAISHHADPIRRDEIKRQFNAEKERLAQKYPEQTWEGTIDQQTALLLSRMSAEIEEAEKREAALNPRPPKHPPVPVATPTKSAVPPPPSTDEGRPASSQSSRDGAAVAPFRHTPTKASNPPTPMKPSESHRVSDVSSIPAPVHAQTAGSRKSHGRLATKSGASSAITTPSKATRHGCAEGHSSSAKSASCNTAAKERPLPEAESVEPTRSSAGTLPPVDGAASPSPSILAQGHSAKVFLTRKERERLAAEQPHSDRLPPVGSPSVLQQQAMC
eukprot:TRINITY_DN5273_c0_g3_i1.p1 TRINITY_DN5273_c0_g3~~TRINITY_DN5273_c0_g3_i1.p1  ORF type:complete len:913 (+),score=143.51 TRINITY_DN5273_c0_g3_i1:83-2821(+)